jgi:golgin subfamily B member 1
MEPTSRAQHSFEEEAEALLQRAGRTRGPAAAAFFLEAAEVYGEKLGRRERAMLCFQQAARADPSDRSLPQQLRTELFAERRFRAVFTSLENERERLGGAGLGEAYLALAEALVDDPTEHQLARQALHWAGIFSADKERTRAANAALASLDASWRERATALWAASLSESQAPVAAELSLSVARLFSWYDSGGAARVKEALDRCFVLWPSMPGALAFLERMAERAGDWAGFANVLENMAEDAHESAAQAELWVRAGTLRLSRLRDAAGALADFRRATLADPARADAVTLGAELLLEKGSTEEALAAFGSLADRLEATGRTREAAALRALKDEVGRPRKAAQDGGPSGARPPSLQLLPPAGASLDSAPSAPPRASRTSPPTPLPFALAPPDTQGDGVPLATPSSGAPEAQPQAAPPAGTVEVRLASGAEAVKKYATILHKKPTDAEAMAALEALLEEPERREEAARALVGAYEAVKEHRKLVGALDVVADLTKDPTERVLALQQAAHVHLHHLRQPELAFAALSRALRLSPGDAGLRSAARRAAEDADAMDGFAGVLSELVGQSEAGPVRAALLRELADVQEKKLDDREGAVAHLEALLAIEPTSVDALRALQRLHRAGEQWAALAKVLDTLASVVKEPAERVALWREAALLHEGKLADRETAATFWRRVAEADPLNREAVTALDRLYIELGKDEGLAFALELRRAQEGQSPQGREATFRLAQLRRDKLRDTAGALQLFEAILVEDPGHQASRDLLEAWARSHSVESATALEILDPVLARTGDHTRRVSIREARMVDALTDEKVRLARELRGILERDMGAPDRAFEAAAQAFRAGVDRPAARADLERLARTSGSYEELAGVYEQLAQKLNEPQEAIDVLRRAAELREHLGLSEQAIKDWQALLAAAPQDRQALDALGRLFEQSRNAKELAEITLKKAQLAGAPAERRALLIRAGASLEAAGDEPRAIDAFKEALALDRGIDGFEALDRLYAKSKDTEAQSDVLAQLVQATSGDVRRGYLLRRAQLLEKQGDLAPAVAGYAQLLEGAPSDANAVAGLERLLASDAVRQEAARVLEGVYRSVNDGRHLVDILEIRIASANTAQRIGLLEEVATLREALGQKELAFAARVRVFAEAPEHAESREQVERLAADCGAFEELAAAYEDQLERGVTNATSTELFRRLSHLYSERLERPELAVKAFEELARREPKNLEVLAALARLHTRQNDWHALAAVTKRQVVAEPSPTKQMELLAELGALAEDSLADKQLAAQAYGEILARKPDDEGAIRALGKVLTESERWPELASLIVREIQLAEANRRPEEMFDLMVRLGRLRLSRLEDPRGALDMFEDVLRRRQGHAGAVGALEEMARSQSPLRGEAAEALEPIFTAGGDHLRLVQVLEARAATEPKAADRAALLRKVGKLYAGPMQNPELAFVAAARALRELPDEEPSLALAVSLAERAPAHEELAALLEEVLPRASSDVARVGLTRALGRTQQTLSRTEEAVHAWERLLEAVPADGEALGALERLHGQAGRSAEVLEVLRRQLAVVEEPSAKTALLLRMASLQDGALQDPVGALATLRRLLELKPDDAEALERMDALCTKAERWPEVADVLARRIALADARTALALKARLGEVRELRLLDKFGALELYREVLTAEPRHAVALPRVEELVRKDPQNKVAADILLSAYRASAAGPKLAEALETRVGASADPFERKTLLLELATLRESSRELEAAFLALWRAFKEDPNDAALRQRLDKLADVTKSHAELAAVYEEELPRIAEASDAAHVSFRLGELLEQRLNDPAKAVESYERARTFDPSLAVPTLQALVRLYGTVSRPDRLAGALDDLEKRTGDPGEKVQLLLRLAQVAQVDLEDAPRAIDAGERVLALDAKNLQAARLLEPLYEASGRQDRLFAALRIQRAGATGAERERILASMVKVSAEGLADLEASIELYSELHARNPRSDQAFTALQQALEKAERWEDLRALLAGRRAQVTDPREQVRLDERLGGLLYRKLGRPEEAVAPLRSALERDARNRGALETLRDVFADLGRRDDLVLVLRRLIPLQDDAAGVKSIRLRMAEVLAELQRREEALDAARRALEVEPHTIPELDRVRQVFVTLRAFGDAVRALELKAEVFQRLEERDQVVSTLFEMADLWTGPGNKPESAAPVLERLLDVDPANRTAYERLLTLYAEVNDWRAHAQLVDRYLSNLVTEEEKIRALRDLGKVREQKLGQKDGAFLALCRALQLDPSDDALREDVERLAEETGSYEELAAVYEQVADELPRGPLATRLYLVLARVQDKNLDDAAAAEAALRKILEFDPTNAQALDALAGTFARRGNDRQYVVALEQKLEAAPSIESRKQILREISRTYVEKLKDVDEGASALMRALDLEPDTETLAELAKLYREQHMWGDLASTLSRARDLAPSLEERARIQVEVAQVQERDLGDEEAAVEAYRAALELDPLNREAVDALERLYTRLNRPADLLAVYERQLELTEDYREKVRILFRSAAIWEDTYQNAANADACVEGILTLDPTNLQAIKTLVRLRVAQGRFEDLVAVLERHIQLATEPQEQADLYVQVGDVFRDQLRRADRAVDAYQAALQVEPSHRPAMHALGLLYERSGNWPFALEVLHQESQVLGRSPESVELFHRMGKINEDMLQDVGTAKGWYAEALRINPDHVATLRALRGLHESEQDWDAYEQVLASEARAADDPVEKAQAELLLARFHSERREDVAAATHWYEEATRHQPDLLDAALPLADLYIAKEAWERAEAMLEVVVRQLRTRAAAEPESGAEKELCRQVYRLGYVAEKLGRRDNALEHYEQAYQLDATYLPALEGYAHLLVQAQRHEQALKVLQTILIHHREDLTDLEVVEVYWQIGEVHTALHQPDRAQNHFEKALAIDPGHEPTLRALIQLADANGQWERSAEYRQSLLQSLDGEPKADAALELGKLAREKLKDSHVAIDAYVQAHRLRPDDVDIMDALYMLFRETRQSQKAAEILERMLQSPTLQSEPQRAKRVWYALGEAYRDELKDVPRAVEAFNAALELDPRFVEAFGAIEQLLSSEKQWKALEENYARMIQRLPKTDDTHAARMVLWRTLGELYQQVLKQPAEALMAFQVAAAGLPEDASVQESYGDLLVQTPGNEEKAVGAYRRALAGTQNPRKVVSALAELAAKRKDYDGAWMAAQVVNGLIGDPGAAEKEILTKLGPYAKKRETPQRGLTDRLWTGQLFHPKLRGPVAEMLGLLFQHAGHLYATPLSQVGINPKRHRIDVSTAPEYQIHHYKSVAKLLGMEAVELFSPFLVATRDKLAKRTSEPAPEPLLGIEICHTHPVCLKVGGRFFTELSKDGQRDTYALLGRTLAGLRPEIALAQRLLPEQLDAVFQAALALAGFSWRWTAPHAVIEAERAKLEPVLPDSARVALARAAQDVIRRGNTDSLKEYLEGADLTGVRCALFVAGDVEPVKRLVQGETGSAFRVPGKAKIRELMTFAVSEDLATLRAAVGTAVEVPSRK